MKRYFKGIPAEEYDEDAVHEYICKFIATQTKEAYKQLLIGKFIEPILQNPDKHHRESDLEQQVTLDPETLKNGLAEDEPPPEFEDQTLEASDALSLDEEPEMH